MKPWRNKAAGFVVLSASLFCACNNPEALMQKGNMAYRDGDLAGAAQYYQQASGVPKTRAAANFNLGRVNFEQGQYEAAKECFDRALDLELEYPLIRVYRARTLLAIGDEASALADLERVTKTHPDLPDGFLELAKLQASRGDLAAAVETIQVARRDQTLTEEATLLSAAWRRELGDISAAIVELESLILTHSFRVPTHFTLASYLLEAGDYREAERRFRRGLEMAPTNVPALLGLAKALREQGKKEEATQLYKLVISSGNPENPLVIQAQEELDGMN